MILKTDLWITPAEHPGTAPVERLWKTPDPADPADPAAPADQPAQPAQPLKPA
jgi:hypothetical protein